MCFLFEYKLLYLEGPVVVAVHDKVLIVTYTIITSLFYNKLLSLILLESRAIDN